MKRIDSVPSPRLDVRDLRVVLALAAAGSTARASEVLHLTQPAVSRALLLAEDKLGARLFERNARGLVPTPAGERLIAGAGPLISELRDLEERACAPIEKATRVKLVCECYTAYRWLPSVLTNLRRVLPGLVVTLVPEHSRDPVPALVSGEIDIALLTTSAIKRPLEERPLFSDEVVFVMASSHPLARRKSLSVRELLGETLVAANSPPAEDRWFFKHAFGKNKPPKVEVMRLPLTEAIVDVARAGMGIAVLSEWIAAPYLGGDDLVGKRLATGPLLRPWRIAYRKEASVAAHRLHGALEGVAPRAHLEVAS